MVDPTHIGVFGTRGGTLGLKVFSHWVRPSLAFRGNFANLAQRRSGPILVAGEDASGMEWAHSPKILVREVVAKLFLTANSTDRFTGEPLVPFLVGRNYARTQAIRLPPTASLVHLFWLYLGQGLWTSIL
jgi:hypothetical protein